MYSLTTIATEILLTYPLPCAQQFQGWSKQVRMGNDKICSAFLVCWNLLRFNQSNIEMVSCHL